MPVHPRIDCPACGEQLVRKPGGRCPHCGADVREHVTEERERETRVDQIVAVVSTLLVIGVFALIGGLRILEGVVMYAIAGAVIWWFARRTFW